MRVRSCILASDTLAPAFSSELLISPGSPPALVDTLSFSFTDTVTHAGWMRAIATSEAGVRTQVISDAFVRATESPVGPVAKPFHLVAPSNQSAMTVWLWGIGTGGLDSASVSFTPTAGVNEHVYVPELALSRGRPNPSGGWVAWEVRRTSRGRVNLQVFGVDGRRVRSWPERSIPEGVTRILWDGSDDRGRRVASGRYYLVVTDEAGSVRSNAATLVR